MSGTTSSAETTTRSSAEQSQAEFSAVQPNGGDWTHRIHRALRGRYRLTLIVASLLAVVGFSIGWEWSGLLYRSEGMVRIASALPPVLKQTDQNQPIPMFDSFIQAQQELMTSRSVLESAVNDAIWSKPEVAKLRLTVEDLATGLKVETRNKSENLRISFTDSRPEVAIAAIKSTITAYQNAYTRDHAEREQRRMRLLEEYRASLKAQLDAATFDPNAPAPAPVAPVGSLQEARPVPQPPQRPTALFLAQNDAEMKRLVELQTRADEEIDRQRIQFGPQHPSMMRAEKDLELINRRVERYVDDMHRAMLARFEDQMRMQTSNTPPQIVAVAPANLSPALLQLKAQLDDVNQRIEILKTEAAMPKRFEVVKSGDFPVVVPDRRIKTAAIGAVGSAAIAVAVMVLAGLLRRQYNYCADVIDDLASYTPFVAAIPELSSNDWRHEADAVQCMHHLRQTFDTHGRAYLVSSATWGSGQSSVTMSLAMSLAAAGLRTLVVDADLGSRGLSRSLQLEKDVGFVDVLSGCEMEFCIKTNRHGLSILPAGLGGEQAGLAFTSAQLTVVLEKFRQKFDVILVDGAPMLAGPETGLIARCVDGLLLTMARGQSRKLIARVLREIQLARCTIIGAVFNRVSLEDFDDSIPHRPQLTGMAASSYRVPEVLADMGPLVRAMASAVRTPMDLRRYVDTKMVNDSRVDVAQQTAESIAA